MRKKIWLPIFFLLAGWNIAIAQESRSRISGDFDNMSLTDFFLNIERQSDYYFYFDTTGTSSIRITLKATNASLEEVLQNAFSNTALKFSIDARKKVFITRDQQIQTGLPDGFFEGNPVAGARSDTVPSFQLDAQKKTRADAENQLYQVGVRTNNPAATATVSGTVRNSKTGESLGRVTIIASPQLSTVTDGYGAYSLSLPTGNHTLTVMGIGMKDTKVQVAVYSDGRLDINLNEQVTTLKEVIVSSAKSANVSRVQMGVERLSIESIRKIPTAFGETDILRAITSLPGVKTVGEASTGFNVRGGSADQNLILFNDNTIYNPSHFFGMFSAFNPEIVKDIELYKSSVPAKYGGRLSSVLDINTREGNKKQISGSAGIGLITSRLHLEGPIGKTEKTSFIFGGRTTYANWLMNLLPDEYNRSSASFQDLNLGLTHTIDSTSTLYFSGYYSRDRFSLASDTLYGYSNKSLSLKWKKDFSNKLGAVFFLGGDEYTYNVTSDNNKVNAFKLGFGIQQLQFKSDFNYFLNSRHAFDFGLNTMRYKLNSGSFVPVGAESEVVPDILPEEQAQESGVYVAHNFTPTTSLSISTGLRYSMFNYLGPQDIKVYAPGAALTDANMIRVDSYGKGENIQTYGGPEIRFSARYSFTSTFSVKAGYNSLRQYIHMLSNTTAIAPTDVWKLSDPSIKPQRGNQVSLGFYKNLKANTIETSVEGYYKKLYDYLDYKPGATLILNRDIEQDVISTEGKAYGVELLVKKPGGKLNGWISYTYSRILLRSSDSTQGALVNNGDFYPANYDKPHDVTLMGNFRVNHRFSVSVNGTYSTGRPITLPVGRYYYLGSQRVLYSDRNAHRIPDYIRMDFSMNIEGNHKVNQKTHNSWTIGAYNLLGRRNPYSVYFVSENGRVNGYKLSIFGSIIPFINYNIRF